MVVISEGYSQHAGVSNNRLKSVRPRCSVGRAAGSVKGRGRKELTPLEIGMLFIVNEELHFKETIS